MRKNAFINVGAFIDGSSNVTLEEGVRVGPYVKILSGTHEFRQNEMRRSLADPTIPRPVLIKRGCWIGFGASILPGVTIAEGCIIAAGALIKDDTDPNCLYAGVPARKVKHLSISE